jgi:hypothetical protein
MKNYSIALMIFGEPGSTRNALTEEKYKKLAAHLIEKQFKVDSILYNDTVSGKLAARASRQKLPVAFSRLNKTPSPFKIFPLLLRLPV